VLLPDPVEPVLAALAAAEPGLLWHLERVRQGGCPRWVGLPVFPWRGDDALADLIALCRGLGVLVFNPHAVTVEDSGLGMVNADQVAAKHAFDPQGLLNPGKLRGWFAGDAGSR
jgi:FAD/FMN-containing dehydrogenase